MIRSFSGDYRFLSNFWPVYVIYNGIQYPSVEHAYQAAKSIDHNYRLLVQRCKGGKQAKQLGRPLERGGMCVLRENWEGIKIPTMRLLLNQKFEVPYLRERLLATGERMIIEGNWWHDTFWGRCTCKRHNDEGENYLGLLLMAIRYELKRD